jgi:hypothetical protein
MSALLTFDLVAIALFVWFALAKIIPSCNVSMFRYRLWRLRDALADEIREGVFDDDTQPKLLLKVIEASIVIAPDIGVVKLLFVRWSARNLRPPEILDLESLSQQDGPRLMGRFYEFRALSVRHVAFGHPSGWVMTSLLIPLALVVTLAERVRRGKDDDQSVIGETRRRLREEVEPGFALLDGGFRGPSAHTLSHMI